MNISAAKIETILAERGMTKASLADTCGFCRQNISIILGRGTAAPKTVGKLAKGLGVRVQDIIGEEV